MHQPNCSFCQLGTLGQRRKGIKSMAAFAEYCLRLYTIGSTQWALSFHPSPLFQFYCMLLINIPQNAAYELDKEFIMPILVPEQGHLPHSCRIPHVFHHHQLSAVQTPIPGSRACLAGLSCSQDCCRNWEPGVKLCRRMPVKKWTEQLQSFLFHSCSNMSLRTNLLSNVTLPCLCGTTLWFPCVRFRFCSTAAL